MEEETAYHEAGHALMAVKLGAKVRHITIEPENDDGPPRYGDVDLEIPQPTRISQQYLQSIIMICLSGPVAEMIYKGEALHPGFVPEWSMDWKHAWKTAESLVPDERLRLRHLEQITAELYRFFDSISVWAAIAGIADEVLAHETLEGEQVEEIVNFWFRNT